MGHNSGSRRYPIPLLKLFMKSLFLRKIYLLRSDPHFNGVIKDFKKCKNYT